MHRSARDAARSHQLMLVDMVPMLYNRTMVLLKLRGQVLDPALSSPGGALHGFKG